MNAYAEDVIIVNSDESIGKYAKASRGFQIAPISITAKINLGNRQTHNNALQQLIRNRDPKLIYSIGSRAYMVARETNHNIPILFSSVLNWRRLPINQNIYGIANEVPSAYQLTMYRYFFPDIKTIGVIYSERYNREWVDLAVRHANDLGITLIVQAISTKADLNSTLEKLLPNVEALWLTADPMVLSSGKAVKTLFKYCDDRNIPVLTYNMTFIKYGATFVIAADPLTMGMQAAGLANDIISGTKIINSIQNPAGTQIGLSTKLISKYAIRLNEEALDSVNEIYNK